MQARTVLWYCTFCGFAVNYMLRINMNITIVDMVRARAATKAPKLSAECIGEAESAAASLAHSALMALQSNSSIAFDEVNMRNVSHRFSLERCFLNKYGFGYDEKGFEWNEYEQGLVLGSFYWLHWITQIPGGILARKFGTKLIFGLGNVIGCWMCFLIPIVSYWNINALLWLRVIQGLIVGLCWPAMHNMTALWIPPNERSKFVTAYIGSSVGTAFFFPMFGYIISWSSWEWVYHVCGIIGTIWYAAWLYNVYDTPSKHPRISPKEREYIESSLASSLQTKKQSIPWKDILTSLPVWMVVAAQWGGIWGLFTLMTQAPTYFKTIHGWSMRMTGILSGLPHIMRMIVASIVSMLSDYLLRTEKMSRTNVRKMATFLCAIVNGLFVVALAYSGCNSMAAVVFLTLATAVHGAVTAGPLASIVDLSPNYSGVLLGISGMIGVLPGFISPAIVGRLTLGNQTITQWKFVFLICAGMLIGSGILYILFASSELQSWNSPNSTAKEMISLKIKTDDKDIKRKKSIFDEEAGPDDTRSESEDEGKSEKLNELKKLRKSSIGA